ncbi:penicillin-binding protein [Micromonospora acroterricola]|uniref:Penicillin-binding protein n=1 Tax=Micromonospora acroterricola TaxID=2202421 RepID=A0A317D3P0_9ACTN|nr:PASTA domain-containing protein [Micromonospora acroterricola]PWR09458.1 penicillin-binding protein [Micromonospora acroterricola]
MSDDRQEPPTGDHDDDRTRPLPPAADRPEPTPPTSPGTRSPDETAPIDRAALPDATAPIDRPASPDATAPIDRAELPDATAPIDRAASPDATASIDRAASAGPAGSPDRTMPIDRSGLTRPGTPVDRTARMPAERTTPAPWSGRAEVRAPQPAEPAGEWYAEEQGGRRWWLPILWGVLALLLAGLLGAALWVVLAAQDDDPDDPGPTPSPPPASATSAAPTSAAPTSAAPSSESPSSPPVTTAPAEVPVPPLAGLPQATAEGLLDRLGLSYRVVYRPSELPPGTVVGTEPEAGATVPTDEEVLLVISQARPSTGTGTGPVRPSPTVTATR